MNKQRIKRLALIAGFPLILLLLYVTGCAHDIAQATYSRVTPETHGSWDYIGNYSLDEEIHHAAVVARVSMVSVGSGTDRRSLDGVVYHHKTREYGFKVHEYLKGGDGDPHITGLVFNTDQIFKTALGAALGGESLPERREYWDDREAIIFLVLPRDNLFQRKAGRYELGVATGGSNHYMVGSPLGHRWLPAASAQPGEQQFLLEPDLRNDNPDTISLPDLKARIAGDLQRVEAQSDEYIACIKYKYELERVSAHLTDAWQGDYPYIRSDVTVGSGLPEGSDIFTHILAPHHAVIPPEEQAQYVLAGKDHEYFRGEMPGHVLLARPLPAGEYRILHNHRPRALFVCDEQLPEAEMGRFELFVEVTAPAGTLYEAFFDPVKDGEAAAVSFSDAPIERIAWDQGTVTLQTGSPDDLAGHRLVFIDLDGSERLSLAVDDATAEADGSLSWKLDEQPWQAGDKLMLRVWSR